MEACVGARHLARKLDSLGHDPRLMPAQYVRPYAKGQKNEFNDAEVIAEAVLRPTMKFVAMKTANQLDVQALHRVRERLVGQRTSIVNQNRAIAGFRRQSRQFTPRCSLPLGAFGSVSQMLRLLRAGKGLGRAKRFLAASEPLGWPQVRCCAPDRLRDASIQPEPATEPRLHEMGKAAVSEKDE